MNIYANPAYSTEQHIQYAQEILLSALPHGQGDGAWYQGLKETFKYWGVFVPFPPRSMSADEGEVTYVESLYDQLRMYANEWLTDYRLTQIETRLIEGNRLR